MAKKSEKCDRFSAPATTLNTLASLFEGMTRDSITRSPNHFEKSEKSEKGEVKAKLIKICNEL